MIDAAAYSRAKRRAVSESWTQKLDVDAFLARAGLANEQPARPPPFVLDVRAPCEYEKGHIPGALSFPLFDDDERATVGTLYKSKGHDVAVARGVELLDAKAPTFLDALPAGLRSGDDVLVYCKRGGMRSGGMAQLLSEGDLRVHTLQGGYQGYRAWANASWAAMGRRLVVLGGKTGSGKTAVLHALRDEHGAQILDLEGVAHHRGSAFGSLGYPPQPTNGHYENILALQWAAFDPAKPVFIEDESRSVGSCGVPEGLWSCMRAPNTPVLRLEVPTEARVDRLVGEYGVYPPEALSDCVRLVRKRLGEAKAEELLALLAQQPPALDQVASALLSDYYDTMYDYQASKRNAEMDGAPHVLQCDTGDASVIARLVLEAVEQRGLF